MSRAQSGMRILLSFLVTRYKMRLSGLTRGLHFTSCVCSQVRSHYEATPGSPNGVVITLQVLYIKWTHKCEVVSIRPSHISYSKLVNGFRLHFFTRHISFWKKRFMVH